MAPPNPARSRHAKHMLMPSPEVDGDILKRRTQTSVPATWRLAVLMVGLDTQRVVTLQLRDHAFWGEAPQLTVDAQNQEGGSWIGARLRQATVFRGSTAKANFVGRTRWYYWKIATLSLRSRHQEFFPVCADQDATSLRLLLWLPTQSLRLSGLGPVTVAAARGQGASGGIAASGFGNNEHVGHNNLRALGKTSHFPLRLRLLHPPVLGLQDHPTTTAAFVGGLARDGFLQAAHDQTVGWH